MTEAAVRVVTLVTALVAVARVGTAPIQSSLPFPHGLGRWLPGLVGVAGRHPVVVATLMALLVVGMGHRLRRPGGAGLAAGVLAVTATLHLLVATAANSQGAIHHGQQLLSQVLWALTLMHLWSVRRPETLSPDRRGDLVVMVIASAYLGAGLHKLLATGGRWILDAPLLVTDIVKTTRDHQVDVGVAVTQTLPPATTLLVDHPVMVGALFSLGLLLELLAPIALLGRLPRILIGTLLIVFHRVADGVMGLSFLEHEALLLLWCVALPLWSWWREERRG